MNTSCTAITIIAIIVLIRYHLFIVVFLFLLAGCMDKNDPGKSEEKGDCPDWSMEQVRTNGFMSLAHWEKVMQSDNGALWLKATKDISCGEEIFLAYDVVL